jgi:hypothetical protein
MRPQAASILVLKVLVYVSFSYWYSRFPGHKNWQIETAAWMWPVSSPAGLEHVRRIRRCDFLRLKLGKVEGSKQTAVNIFTKSPRVAMKVSYMMRCNLLEQLQRIVYDTSTGGTSCQKPPLVFNNLCMIYYVR